MLLRRSHDRRNGVEPGRLGRAQPALPHHQLVLIITQWTHHHGLQQTDLTDGRHQFGQRILVEHLPRLLGVRANALHGQVGVVRARGGFDRKRFGASRFQARIGAVNQVAEPSTQARTGFGGGHDCPFAATPRWAISLAAARYAWEPAEAWS